MLPRIAATAYLTPLREGGSLPGLMEADDDGTYVVKFTGAGQGPKALVAEIVVGELARRLDILVPELALIELDAEIGRREPDQEVQALLSASAGLNLARDFLPGSVGYDRTFELMAEDARLIARLRIERACVIGRTPVRVGCHRTGRSLWRPFRSANG